MSAKLIKKWKLKGERIGRKIAFSVIGSFETMSSTTAPLSSGRVSLPVS